MIINQDNVLRFSATSLELLRETYANLTRRHHQLPELKAKETALLTLLFASTVLCGLFLVLLLVSYSVAGNTQVGSRVLVALVSVVYLFVASVIAVRGHQAVAAILMLMLYTAIATTAMWFWSINMPLATLIMSMTITLAGILLGSRFAIYAAAFMSIIVLLLQYLVFIGVHTLNASVQRNLIPRIGNAVGFSLLFMILGLITWLFGRQNERALFQARRAEEALLEEKSLLAVRLKQKTENLRAAQLQEMQQLYRFAQLGQLSTALLHDLANHLTSLTLDIEDLQQQQHTQAIERAKQSIAHLDNLIAGVSKQLQDQGEIVSFNAVQNVREVAATLRPRFVRHKVSLKVEQTGLKDYLQVTGDPLRFSQIINILIINALDAVCVPTILKDRRQVRVELRARKSAIEIRVSDWGDGIPDVERHKLFTPFYSTKAEGMGIGLFITEQIVKTHFHGSIRLESAVSPTSFMIVLPHRKRHGH